MCRRNWTDLGLHEKGGKCNCELMYQGLELVGNIDGYIGRDVY